jgi:hypothetical protein
MEEKARERMNERMREGPKQARGRRCIEQYSAVAIQTVPGAIAAIAVAADTVVIVTSNRAVL